MGPSGRGDEERILTGLAKLVLVAASATLLTSLTGCSGSQRASEPSAPPAPAAEHEVVGTLVAMKDDRPVDGGIDLTLLIAPGDSVRVRVGSIFIAGPRDSVRAMHEVVDAAKIGDRLRARGTRDETGALQAQVLERVP